MLIFDRALQYRHAACSKGKLPRLFKNWLEALSRKALRVMAYARSAKAVCPMRSE